MHFHKYDLTQSHVAKNRIEKFLDHSGYIFDVLNIKYLGNLLKFASLLVL